MVDATGLVWSAPFRLMDLPIEVRNMVYHYLWVATPRVCVPLVPPPLLQQDPNIHVQRVVSAWKNGYRRLTLSCISIEISLPDEIIPEGKGQSIRIEVTYSGESFVKNDEGIITRPITNFPRWLLTSKTLLTEGIAQLRLKAAWSTIPDYSPNWRSDIPEDRLWSLLDPTEAQKLTFRAMVLALEYSTPGILTRMTLPYRVKRDLMAVLVLSSNLKVLRLQCTYQDLRAFLKARHG